MEVIIEVKVTAEMAAAAAKRRRETEILNSDSIATSSSPERKREHSTRSTQLRGQQEAR